MENIAVTIFSNTFKIQGKSRNLQKSKSLNMIDEETIGVEDDLEDLNSYAVEDLKNWLDSEC